TVIVNKLHFFERVFYFNPFTCNTFTIIVAPSSLLLQQNLLTKTELVQNIKLWVDKLALLQIFL
ncbi:MAG: hypothetical protein V7K89_24600, partial [Nostoc sp.]|uniref:hypothetical protein n=1 Tax=Nostoc sp. TaxID=1180 RepID=UPI002FFD10F6